ncbi:hypothetical protein QC282_05400 [Streptomyces sp. DH24]|nr:hypothetical protein [Streptomyces sp. DH24]MDG9716048.1 hypothetical protein [Streptomyces sp. DH24]
MTLDYPLGVVMTLQTGGATRFRSRTLTGARPDGDPMADLLLLDGQQRGGNVLNHVKRDV